MRDHTTVTARQIELLRFIADYRHTNDFAPSQAEMCAALGLSPNSKVAIAEHLGRLEHKGLIRRRPGMARTISLTELGRLAVAVQAATTEEV